MIERIFELMERLVFAVELLAKAAAEARKMAAKLIEFADYIDANN